MVTDQAAIDLTDERRGPLPEQQWSALVDLIRAKECTPFLGAGIAVPTLPTGGQLARELAGDGYPFTDAENLPRVAQYLAIVGNDNRAPKLKVRERLAAAAAAAGAAPEDGALEAHEILASLDLPVYVTTNYDDLLVKAIERRHPGRVAREVARWNREVERRAGEFTARDPTPASPLVFHLHGHSELLASMVLTEDDYVEFVTAVARNRDTVVPPVVLEALSWSSLLVVGYSLNDWNFHVLLRLLMKDLAGGQERLNVSVQLPPHDRMIVPERRAEAERFIAAYLDATSVQIHWGDARSFLQQLHDRHPI